MVEKINAYELLEKIRKLLNLTIEDMCDQMNGPNRNYYYHIRTGRVQGNATDKRASSPTLNKIFDGINYAIDTYPHGREHASEITSIVITELIKIKK